MLAASLLLIFIASLRTIVHAASVDFLERTPGSYLQISNSNLIQEKRFTDADVSAIASVLLGTAPLSISDESAAKLNEILVPNPFHRPHAVLMLTVEQTESDSAIQINSIHHWDLERGNSRAVLTLPESTTIFPLNSTFEEEDISLFDIDVKLQELADFLGGSYKRSERAGKGTLFFNLKSGETILDLTRGNHWVFVEKLLYIVEQTKSAAVTLKDFPGGLVFGTLPSTMELYGKNVVQEKSDIVLVIVNKLFAYLDAAFDGGLVGIIVHAKERILDIKLTWTPSRLQLLQTSSDTITAAAAEVLIENIIAYITGILFIVALVIGSCFLFKMPVTRDTLLYSGAKLD